MAIKFSCACGHRMGAPEGFAGRRAKCPACGAAVQIPASSPPPTQPPSKRPTNYDIEVMADPPPDSKIRFHCENCGHRIGVPVSFAGKKGRCPGCNEAVEVPLSSPVVPAAKAPSRRKTDYGMKAIEPVATAPAPVPAPAPTGGGARRSSRRAIVAVAVCGVLVVAGVIGVIFRPHGGDRKVANADPGGSPNIPARGPSATASTPATVPPDSGGTGADPNAPPQPPNPSPGTPSTPAVTSPQSGAVRIVGTVSSIDAGTGEVIVDGAPKGGARRAYHCALIAEAAADADLLWSGLKVTLEGEAKDGSDPTRLSECKIVDADKSALYDRARRVLTDKSSDGHLALAERYAALLRRLGRAMQADILVRQCNEQREQEARTADANKPPSPGPASHSGGNSTASAPIPPVKQPPADAGHEPASADSGAETLKRFRDAFAAARSDPQRKIDALDLLRDALDHQDVVKEIGQILISDGESPEVRTAAAELLAHSRNGSAVSYFEKLLERQGSDEAVARGAISAIGNIPRPQSVKALARIVADRGVRLDDEKSLRMGMLAISALGKLRSPDSMDSLLKTYAWLEGKKLKTANPAAGGGDLNPDLDQMEEKMRKRIANMSDDELWQMIRKDMIAKGQGDPDDLLPEQKKLIMQTVRQANGGGSSANGGHDSGGPSPQAAEREQRRQEVVGAIEGALGQLTDHSAQGYAGWKKWWDGARKSYRGEIEPDPNASGDQGPVAGPGDSDEARTLLSCAISFEKGGMNKEAIEKYRTIVEKYANTPQAAEAKKHLDVLQPTK